MKKIIAITTLCAAVLCSGTLITASAEQTDGITIPDSFTVQLYNVLNSADNYAVDENQYAISDGNLIYIYTADDYEIKNGNVYYSGNTEIYTHGYDIQEIEYSGGGLYFSDSEGETYVYSDGGAVSADFSFTAFNDSDSLDDGNYTYYINTSNGYLVTINKTSSKITYDNSAIYKHLKTINGVYYVLKGNYLCTISNGAISSMYFSYEDYDNVNSIEANGTAQALTEVNGVQIAEIPAGASLIRVNSSYLSEDSFTVVKVTFAEETLSAQVLYMPDGGNAALVAVGSVTYLALKDNLTVTNYTPAETTGTYYPLNSACVYSAPFENESTKIDEIDKDTAVTVTGYYSDDVFDYNYYKAEYTNANGETASGYIVSGLLTAYTFENDNYAATTIESGDQSYDNDVFTIVLVMVIILLVLVAVGYIIFVATSNKKKPKKKK